MKQSTGIIKQNDFYSGKENILDVITTSSWCFRLFSGEWKKKRPGKRKTLFEFFKCIFILLNGMTRSAIADNTINFDYGQFTKQANPGIAHKNEETGLRVELSFLIFLHTSIQCTNSEFEENPISFSNNHSFCFLLSTRLWTIIIIEI